MDYLDDEMIALDSIIFLYFYTADMNLFRFFFFPLVDFTEIKFFMIFFFEMKMKIN